jgi:hypothetical protein
MHRNPFFIVKPLQCCDNGENAGCEFQIGIVQDLNDCALNTHSPLGSRDLINVSLASKAPSYKLAL